MLGGNWSQTLAKISGENFFPHEDSNQRAFRNASSRNDRFNIIPNQFTSHFTATPKLPQTSPKRAIGQLEVWKPHQLYLSGLATIERHFHIALKSQQKPRMTIGLYKTLAQPVLSYGSEAWTVKNKDASRITANESSGYGAEGNVEIEVGVRDIDRDRDYIPGLTYRLFLWEKVFLPPLAALAFNKRADIIAIGRKMNIDFDIDPTVRLEESNAQRRQVDREKKRHYEPCLTYLEEKYTYVKIAGR
ncbi:hypothetical protein ANN_04823 [Periplaneta americana]|uniref:Uncharacterized protein n=1 Tax=Periplaneta americana TaxID=6978 RepID=A0ABQ8T9J1_PERAM|nr:hypothetical protein ANN_04823 [Periplaneta americana]